MSVAAPRVSFAPVTTPPAAAQAASPARSDEPVVRPLDTQESVPLQGAPSLAQTLAKEALAPRSVTPTLANAAAAGVTAGSGESKKAKEGEVAASASAVSEGEVEVAVAGPAAANQGRPGVAGVPGIPGATVASGVPGASTEEGSTSVGEVSTPTHRVAVESQGRQAAQTTQNNGETQQNQNSNSSSGGNMEGGTGGGDGSGGGHSSGGQDRGHQHQSAQNAINSMPIQDLQQLVQMLFGDGQSNTSGQNSGQGAGEGSGDSEVLEELGEVADRQTETAPPPSVEEAIQARTLSRVSDLVDPSLDFTHILRKPKG